MHSDNDTTALTLPSMMKIEGPEHLAHSPHLITHLLLFSLIHSGSKEIMPPEFELATVTQTAHGNVLFQRNDSRNHGNHIMVNEVESNFTCVWFPEIIANRKQACQLRWDNISFSDINIIMMLAGLIKNYLQFKLELD